MLLNVVFPQSFNQNLHPEERFSPCDLIEKIKEQKEELGLIIDLTYTTRYYGPEVSVGLSIEEGVVSSSPEIAAEREDLCEKVTLKSMKHLNPLAGERGEASHSRWDGVFVFD